MPRKFALPIATLVWAASAAFMWAVLIGVNVPVICGRVFAPWAYVAEKIVFLPTIWVTQPLDAWLDMRNAGMAVTIGSVIETVLLATLYSTIIYLSLRRKLIDSIAKFARRFGLVVVVVIVVMIGSSVWLRAQLRSADYAAPLTHDAPTVTLNIRTPMVGDQKIAMTGKRSLSVPQYDDQWIVARDGAPPLAIAVSTNYVREPRFYSTTEYVLNRVFPDHLETLPNVQFPERDAHPIGEPRCAYGNASEVLIALPGSRGRSFNTMSFSGSFMTRSLDLDSPEVVNAPEGTYIVGFNGRDLEVTRDAEVLGTLADVSDHTLNNVAFVRTDDGILHILDTEVLIPHDNSSRVRYLRLDPKSKKWLTNEVLAVRSKFTSTSTPRISRNGNAVDAYWRTDGGADQFPEDGIYVHRIGQRDAWHLITERTEFAVLDNADGKGGTLVGAATRANESGVVRWFYRKDSTWYDIGQTDAGETLYTMVNTGTEPFALWRGDTPGTVHAAFNAISHVVIEDLQLPEAEPKRLP